MTETYTVVGSQSTWLMCATPLALIPALLLMKRTRPDMQLGWVNWWVAWYAVAFAMRLPQEWILGGSLCVIALSLSLPTRSPLRAKKLQRAIMLAACLPLGLFVATFPLILAQERIILTDRAATYMMAGSKRASIPRQGLAVHASYDSGSPIRVLSWPNRSYIWTTYGANRAPGPDVSSALEYWGPHGLVSSNDLGRHIAAWAGATIEYRDFAEPTRVASTLAAK